jgi:hypothetical protein
MLLSHADDHDTREKILKSILTLMDKCTKNLLKNQHSLTSSLRKIKNEYANKMADVKTDTTADDDDSYFKDMLKVIDTILSHLEIKQEL